MESLEAEEPSRRGTPRADVVAGGLALIAALVLVSYWITPWYPFDDAYISFRYAANWADGFGPVWNVDEKVEGYSNFLWVSLIAIGELFGVTAPLGARFLGLGSLLWMVVLLLRGLPSRLAGSLARYWAVVLLVFSWYSIGNLLSGLETPLTAALLLAAALALERRKASAPILFLALALARPEGVLYGIFGGAFDLWRTARETSKAEGSSLFDVGFWRTHVGQWTSWLKRWALGAGVPYTLYFLWRVLYYGHLLPASILAKRGAPPLKGLETSLKYLELALEKHLPLIGILLLGIVFGVWRFFERRRSATASPEVGQRSADGDATSPEAVRWLAFLAVAIVALTGSGDPYLPYLRYAYPIFPLALVLAIGAWERAVATVGRGRLARSARAVMMLVISALFAWQLTIVHRDPGGASLNRNVDLGQGFDLFFSQDFDPHVVEDSPLRLGLYHMAEWLRDNAKEGDIVVTSEIGIVGYYTRLPMIDTFGLITERIATKKAPPGARAAPKWIFNQEPEFVIQKKARRCLCGGIEANKVLWRDSRLRSDYDLVRSFPNQGQVILLFQRRPDHEKPKIVYDFCFRHRPTNIKVYDRFGTESQATDGARASVSRREAHKLKSRYEALKRETIAAVSKPHEDFELADLMRRWMAEASCFARQLPVKRPAHDLVVQHQVDVPENARLSFGIDVPKDPRNPERAPDVVFEIEVEDASESSTVLFQDSLSVTAEGMRCFTEIDMSAYAGQEIDVNLRIYQVTEEKARQAYNAGWLDMVLYQPTDAASTYRDFADELCFSETAEDSSLVTSGGDDVSGSEVEVPATR